MLVSAFAVLALAFSAVAAPIGVQSPKDTTTTDPQHAQNNDVTTTNSHKQDGATNSNVALTFTSPVANDVWTSGQPNHISWTVSDDLKQKTGSFFLEKAGGQLNQDVSLALNIPLSQGSVTVTPSAASGTYFVALMVDGANVAKSAQFTIKSSEGENPTTKGTSPNTKGTNSGSKDTNTNGGKVAGDTPQNSGTGTPQGKN